jgi:hypothetical protein
MKNTKSTLFHAYNARFLEPREVAETFVPSHHFYRLLERSNSLVIGPRGSGKTTLLMMLQEQTLEVLRNRSPDLQIPDNNFTGAFIPTDITWSKQLETLASANVPLYKSTLLTDIAFTLHVLRCLLSAMEFRCKKVNLANHVESDIAKTLSDCWKLERSCLSLASIRYLLLSQLNKVHATVHPTSASGREGEVCNVLDAFPRLDLLSSVSLAVEIFNDFTGNSDRKWALLFDELELAPSQIRKQLMSYLRSVNNKLLFKLSLVPFSDEIRDLSSFMSASEQNDFSVIQLWYSNKNDERSFSRKLWKQLVKNSRLENRNPEEILGTSIFDTDPRDWQKNETAYHKESRQLRRFRSLAKKDLTFQQYLDKEGIDLDEVESISPERRAATVRKVSGIVAIRDSVLSERSSKDGTLAKRSRATLEIYSGANAMFAMLEGNPRWFKAVIGDLILAMTPNQKTIRASKQARAIEKASERFRALLRTIPCPKVNDVSPQQGIITLIDTIGDYFSKELTKIPFTPDPHNSFAASSDSDEQLIRSLGAAINAGALVWIPKSDADIVSSDLRGKRLRLTYLFSPFYRLLLRTGKQISLTTITKQPAKKKVHQNELLLEDTEETDEEP